MKGTLSFSKDRLALLLDDSNELLVLNSKHTWTDITSKVPAPKWNTVPEINIRVRDICQAIAAQNPDTMCMVYDIPVSVVEFFRLHSLGELFPTPAPLNTAPRDWGDITVWGPLYG